jgi:hypothetical protein
MSLTRAMSRINDSKGNFEDVNEEVNNTKLSQRFECLYSQKWVLLIKWMLKNCQAMPEVERISHITNLMKVFYKQNISLFKMLIIRLNVAPRLMFSDTCGQLRFYFVLLPCCVGSMFFIKKIRL